MPADIRSFFGGGSSAAVREKEKKEEESKKKRGSRKIIEDSDDEEPITKKATPKKAVLKKAIKRESPKGTETNPDDFFASSKPKPTKAAQAKPTPAKSTPTKSKTAMKPASNGRPSSRKKNEALPDDEDAFLDNDEDAGDDIFAADAKTIGRRKDDGYIEVDSDDDPVVVTKKSKTTKIESNEEPVNKSKKPAKSTSKPAPKSKVTSRKTEEDTDMEDAFVVQDDDDDMMVLEEKSAKKTNVKKRKSPEFSDEEEDDLPVVKPAKGKSAKPPPAKKPRAPKNKEAESSSIQAILDAVPTVRAPTPPPKDDSKKFDWKTAQAGGGNSGPPPAAGLVEIPTGADNCLTGMTFVFTGLGVSLSRDEGQELVKRYGGKVTSGPSGKTSYVVLGSDAGPSKLRKIQDLKIKTIDEDGLFYLLRTLPANGGDGKAAEKNMEKKKADEAKIKKEAEAMEKEEKRVAAEAAKAEQARKMATSKGTSLPPAPRKAVVPPSAQLWTTKYAPSQLNQICGNKGQVEKIQNWLKGWQVAHKYDFKKKGADGTGGYRAIIIHGPPGIGKTTAAHLAAKLAGYDVIESNASDTRSKKMVENGFGDVLNNTSMLGFFTGDGKDVQEKKKNIVLIMDEVDGMSGGDRGGVGAMAKICKTTDVPMILICNDRKLPKMKPFDFVTLDVPFRRPTVDQVRSRVATICHREGLKLPMQVIDNLIEGSNKDIRQIINMISTAKLDQDAMDFDKGKAMTKAWEKHVVLKPWDICSKMLSAATFSANSKMTLNDKSDLYFNDHEFTPLMIQENYLSTQPTLAGNAASARERKLKVLQLTDNAAESISDGDLVDRMIHGSTQQWGLMPTHAIFSTVRPASFIHGNMSSQATFTKWLGNNSKYGKLTRYVKEIHSHMRLRTSGDRHEIRQQYLPVLYTQMNKRMEVDGKECVDEVIDLMDSYFLTRDDFDFIGELGVGDNDEENLKIDSQAKATFTRLYNTRNHPLPFMKASATAAPAKVKMAKPDLEEAFEDEDEGEEVAVEIVEDEDAEIDFKKDKYIKKPKKKAAPKKAAGKKKAGKNEEDDDVDMDESEDEKPKKKGRGPAKSRAKK